MPEIDIAAATWIERPRAVIARTVADAARWPRWWPELALEPAELRDPQGVKWRVPAADGGRLRGSMEIWLQAVDGGTVAHYFLWLDGVPRPLGRRARARCLERHRRRGRAVLWSIADELDPGRLARVAAPPATLRTDGRIP